MSLIQVDLAGWLPESLKRQIIDSVVTFVADQAKKALGDEVSQALKRLRSDAAFQDAVDQGLKEATERFVREYTVEDEDLVTAIARDPDFWKAESVRQALWYTAGGTGAAERGGAGVGLSGRVVRGEHLNHETHERARKVFVCFVDFRAFRVSNCHRRITRN